MLGDETDMPETPDAVLRALADPERLAIAGALAREDRTAASLAEAFGLPERRVRQHLTRLTAAGVARLGEDRSTYRLDPETLRWAAEQVGPPREAGLALGAANGLLAMMPVHRLLNRLVGMTLPGNGVRVRFPDENEPLVEAGSYNTFENWLKSPVSSAAVGVL